MTTNTLEKSATPANGTAAPTLRVRWDEGSAKPSCPNVCNVMRTREGVILSFGLARPSQDGQQEIPIQATDRIVLNRPSAARLALLLAKAVQDGEARSGPEPTPAA
jgi:hypothetical protein